MYKINILTDFTILYSLQKNVIIIFQIGRLYEKILNSVDEYSFDFNFNKKDICNLNYPSQKCL